MNIEQKVIDLEKRVSAIEKVISSGASSAESRKRKTSVVEFLLEKAPKQMVDEVLVVAVYHDKFESAESFSGSDLRELMIRAKLNLPKNMSAQISTHVKKGHFGVLGSGKRGSQRWYVTNSGIQRVEKGFGANV